MKLRWPILTAAILLLLTACGTRDSYSGRLILDGTHTLGEGETLEGELLVTGGQITLEPGSRVSGSVLVLGGTVEANGEIGENATLLLGKLTLGSEARVLGNLEIGGGELERSTEAQVLGQVDTGIGVQLPDVDEIPRRSLANRLIGILLEAPLLALVSYLAARYLPLQINHLRQAAFKHGFLSLALGLLAWVVGLSLMVMMLFTLLLIPVSLLGIFLLLFATAYGCIPYAIFLGEQLGQVLKLDLQSPQAAAVGAVLSVAILELSPLIPLVGSLIPLPFMLAGLGAVMLTRFGLYPFIPPLESESLLS